MRIGIFTATFLPKIGGTELSVDRMARHFAARGHRVVVITHDKAGRPNVDYPVFQFARPRFRRKWPGVYALPLRRAWREHRFDALLCVNANPTAYAAWYARKLGARFAIVANPRGGDLHPSTVQAKPRRWQRWTRLGYRRADRIIAISSAMRQRVDEFVGPPLPPVDVVYNGVDVAGQRQRAAEAQRAASTGELAQTAELADLAGRPFVLHLARVEHLKRQATAAEAIARCAQPLRARGVRYVFAGNGPGLDDLRQRIVALGIDDLLWLPGMVHEPLKAWLLSHAALFISTSAEEGMPNAMLEAIAHGRPVLASDIPAHRDIVEARGCGRLFAVDDVAALAEQLIAILDADLEPMRRAALLAAEQVFSYETMIDGYERSLAAAITARSGASSPIR